MSRYKAYPDYRDSGVEWLGKIPCDWDCVRLKFASELSGGKVALGNDERYVGLENVQSNRGKFISTEEITPEGISNTFSCGDVLFSKLRPYLAKSWLADFSGICSSEFLVLTSRKVDAKFLHYFTLTEEFIEQVDSSTYGSKMPRASWDFIGLLDIPVPPHESKKIAEFLDHETAKIDALIEKQQRLIELLKEKRQAVISHAVTKGLNPNAPMKDSGVEWLGEVPAHWELLKGGYIGKLFGSEAVSDDDVVSEGEFPFLKVSSLGTEGIEISNFDFYVSTPASLRVSFSCDYLVFPKRGAAIFTNKVNYVNVASAIDPNLMGWKINKKTKPAYIAHLLKLRGLGDIADVSTVPQINNKHIEPMKFPVPPVNEQMLILSYLDDELPIFDSLSEKAQTAIALAHERRAALISAAVTGKIDVRDWQAAAAQEAVGVEC